MTRPASAHPADRLAGAITVPGDKSISHRALMLATLAVGESVITGLLEGEDVLRTAAALGSMGARIVRDGPGRYRVHGVGVGGLAEPDAVLDMGNAGTGARLLMGLVATHPFTSFFTGDASLRRRPMARVVTPLQQFGAAVVARSGGRLPLAVVGAIDPVPISYRLPVASAQVKSAVLLAGLNTAGETTVIETEPTRDHSERLLAHFGATLRRHRADDGAHAITIVGQPELRPASVLVPGDPSSAAFPLVAALLARDGEVRIQGVGVNPTRTGLIATLTEMGASLTLLNPREQGGEPVADLVIRPSRLQGVTVPAARAPTMIDEYPILAVAAAAAEGRTVMHGLAELRVKESDRLAAIAAGLAACGVAAEITADTLTVIGAGGAPPGGGSVATHMDHRIAMAFLVLGLGARQPVVVDDIGMIATSFPGFLPLMRGLGARIETEEPAA